MHDIPPNNPKVLLHTSTKFGYATHSRIKVWGDSMSLFRRILSYGGLAIMLFIATLGPVSAATNAYSAKFITSMTYMNIGSGPANLSVKFIDATGTTITYPLSNTDGSARTLAVNASASLSVSVLPVASTTASTGSWLSGAVIEANQPLVTTMVQVSTDPTIRVRPVSNGFGIGDAHTAVSLPSVYKACTTSKLTTRFNVQNIGPSSDDITTTLYWPNGDLAFTQTDSAIAAGQIVSIDMRTIAVNAPTSAGYSIPRGCLFEGSALIESTGTSKLVATAFETSTNGRNAAAYEGIKSPGGNAALMPSALCKVNYGDGAQTSSYIVHNSSANDATVRITYKYQIRATNGTLGRLSTKSNIVKGTVQPNNTLTINACDDLPDRAVGSAVITTAGDTPTRTITAVGIVSGTGVYAVAPGLPRGSAIDAVVYAPYVRYSSLCFTASPTKAVCRNESRQRTLFSVQNTSYNTAIKVRVTLYNHLGEVVGSPYISANIPAYSKLSISPADIGAVSTAGSDASEFGYWVVSDNIVYGGSAKFEALTTGGSSSTIPLAVTVRVLNSTAIGQTAEDYNAIP